MADSYLPEIDQVTVRETTADVDLNKFGIPVVAKLKARSNFSDYIPPRDDKSEKIAQFYSKKFGCEVAPFTVRLCDRLVSMWDAPLFENGKKPTTVYFVKLSITNKNAFTELVNALNDEAIEDDIDETVGEARENFTETDSGGSE